MTHEIQRYEHPIATVVVSVEAEINPQTGQIIRVVESPITAQTPAYVQQNDRINQSGVDLVKVTIGILLGLTGFGLFKAIVTPPPPPAPVILQPAPPPPNRTCILSLGC